jgi:hypothetical protein
MSLLTPLTVLLDLIGCRTGYNACTKADFACRLSLCVYSENAGLFKPQSYQLNDLPLGVMIDIDVSLGDAQARVPSQHLDVSQRSTYERHFSRCIGDEGASPAVT